MKVISREIHFQSASFDCARSKTSLHQKKPTEKKIDLKTMDWDNWNKDIEDSLCPANLADLSRTEDPNKLWDSINNILVSATNANSKLKISSIHSKPYWTPLLTDLSNKLRDAQKVYLERNTDSNLAAHLQNMPGRL